MQILVIHGGDAFDTHEEYISFLKNFEVDLESLKEKKWKSSLQEELGSNFEVLQPRMPNSFNCRYIEWKLWFEKYLPLLESEIILIGHSMGAIFLAKYLSENGIDKNVRGLFLVAAPYDEEVSNESLVDFALTQDLSNLQEKIKNIFIYHSRDDEIVPFADFEKYKKDIPNATFRVFQDRGHFNQEEFPEIIEDIKSVS